MSRCLKQSSTNDCFFIIKLFLLNVLYKSTAYIHLTLLNLICKQGNYAKITLAQELHVGSTASVPDVASHFLYRASPLSTRGSLLLNLKMIFELNLRDWLCTGKWPFIHVMFSMYCYSLNCVYVNKINISACRKIAVWFNTIFFVRNKAW